MNGSAGEDILHGDDGLMLLSGADILNGGDGNAGDVVTTSGTWTNGGSQTNGGVAYNVYTANGYRGRYGDSFISTRMLLRQDSKHFFQISF